MFSAFQTFGRLGAGARAVAAAWTPAALWPTGTEAGLWIDPSNLTSQWQDSTGTTPVATPGSVADSSNPVGLALDIRAGATVLTDPGNHMLQSTSAARPLMSARVNLLTYTEDSTVSPWNTAGTSPTQTATGVSDPDGENTAQTWSFAAITYSGDFSLLRYPVTTVASAYSGKFAVRAFSGADVGKKLYFYLNDGSFKGLTTITLTTNWQYPEITETLNAGTTQYSIGTLGASYGGENQGAVSVDLCWPQFNSGVEISPYQSVPSNGSTYASGPPIAQLYDGVDDGMATAAFAAGTLINGMDCMIAVRRDSAASCVAGLYNGIADATKFFGMAESASGSGCVGSGAGTPTVWVDGVQLTGGTAVTRGTLHTALTVGDYHVLEFRGLDLSTWTASGFGLYTSYVLNGVQGGILLFPSSTSAADRDAARTWLGAKVGLTL